MRKLLLLSLLLLLNTISIEGSGNIGPIEEPYEIVEKINNILIISKEDSMGVIRYNNGKYEMLLEPIWGNIEVIEGTKRFLSLERYCDEEDELCYIFDTKTGKMFKNVFQGVMSFLATSDAGISFFYGTTDGIEYILTSDGTLSLLPTGMEVELTRQGQIKATLGCRSVLFPLEKISLLPSMVSTSKEKKYLVDYHAKVGKDRQSSVYSDFRMMIDYPGTLTKESENIRFWMSEEIRNVILSAAATKPNLITGLFIPIGEIPPVAIYNFYRKEYFSLNCVEDSMDISHPANICIGQQMNTDDIVTYYVGKYSYAGGTHGITCIYYKSFDKTTGKPYTTEDVFKEGKIHEVVQKINKKIGKIYTEKHDDEEYENDQNLQFPSMGIGLLPEGVAFCYQPYEVDAFAWGHYKFVIPYEELMGCLKISDGAIKKMQAEAGNIKLGNISIQTSESTYDMNPGQSELSSKKSIVDEMINNGNMYSESFLQNVTELTYLSERYHYPSTEFEAASLALMVADSLYGKENGITIAAADRWCSLANPSDGIVVLKPSLRFIDKHFGKDNSAYADRLRMLIDYEDHLEQRDSVINHSMELVSIYEKLYGKGSNTYDLYNLIAQQQAILGRYKEAIKSQELALDFDVYDLNPSDMQTSMDVLIEGFVNKAMGYDRLMYYYYMDGQYKKAIEVGEADHDTMSERNDSAFHDRDIILSILHYRNEDYEKSKVYTKKWAAKLPKYIIDNFKTMKGDERNQLWNNYAYFYNDFLPLLALKTKDEDLQAASYNAILLGKSIMLNTEMELRQAIIDSDNPDVAGLYDELAHTREILKDSIETLTSWEADTLSYWADKIENDLVRKSDVYGDYTRKLSINYHDVESKLGSRDIAIEFVEATDSGTVTYLAIVLKKGMKNPVVVPLFCSEHVKMAKDMYNKKDLSALIWQPLSSYINDIDRIYFAPAGELYNIAVESLPHWEKDGVISDYWSIYRLSSTRQIALTDQDNNQIGNAVIYGGLDYDTDTTFLIHDSQKHSNNIEIAYAHIINIDSLSLRGAISDITELPETKIEAEKIGKILKRMKVQTTLYFGENGTEASFKALSGKKRQLLHIATHGFYWTEEEKIGMSSNFLNLLPSYQNIEDKALTRSGLLFAGANNIFQGETIPNDVDDGVLTAKEIAKLDLHGLDLVVLSACQTGLGEISGDGVLGLQRGFKKAGANSLLMSLWKVDDQATCFLMTQFYENLAKGKNKNLALEQAKKAVRLKKDKGWDDPKYWAAFILLDALD